MLSAALPPQKVYVAAWLRFLEHLDFSCKTCPPPAVNRSAFRQSAQGSFAACTETQMFWVVHGNSRVQAQLSPHLGGQLSLQETQQGKRWRLQAVPL